MRTEIISPGVRESVVVNDSEGKSISVADMRPRWEIANVADSVGASYEILKLLSDGWEPFATLSPNGSGAAFRSGRFLFRRPV